MEIFISNHKSLLSVYHLIVTHIYFINMSFVAKMKHLGLKIISCFRKNGDLRYFRSSLKIEKKAGIRSQLIKFTLICCHPSILLRLLLCNRESVFCRSDNSLIRYAAIMKRFLHAILGTCPNLLLNNNIKELLLL